MAFLRADSHKERHGFFSTTGVGSRGIVLLKATSSQLDREVRDFLEAKGLLAVGCSFRCSSFTLDEWMQFDSPAKVKSISSNAILVPIKDLLGAWNTLPTEINSP